MKFVGLIGVAFMLVMFIVSTADNIANMVKPPSPAPVLEFIGSPTVTAMSNGKVTIIFQVRRNESCKTTIHVRWWNMDTGGYDVQYSVDFEAARARVTDTFEPFPVTIPHPVEAGNWAYAPLIDPGHDCRSDAQIQAPLAFVNVP